MNYREQYPAQAPVQAPPAPHHGDAFDRLPDHAKDMILEEEMQREMRLRDLEERRKKTKMRYIIEGMVIFFLVAVLGGPLAWAVGAAFGAGVGYVAWRTGGGALSFGLVGLVAWAIYWAVFGVGGGGYLAIYSALLCIGLCTAVGCAHGMQKYDGSEC